MLKKQEVKLYLGTVVLIELLGWYMSCLDVILVIVDMVILVLFGSTLSSIISYPLKTQGQLSADRDG